MLIYLLYRAGQFIALHLPLKAVYAIAVFISELHYICAPADRQGVYHNLKTIFPEKDEREIRRIRIDIFRNFAKYLVDFFRYPLLSLEYINSKVSVENRHYLDEALLRGKGAVILTAHIGNWELGGVIIAKLGYPFWAVALAHKDKRINSFFDRQRESMGINVIPMQFALRRGLRLLKENNFIALLGDRDFTRNGGVPVDFFGKKALLPQGPAILALKSGAAIVPGYLVRNADDTFRLCFEKPIYSPSSSGEDGQDILKLLDECKGRIENWIKHYPGQWYVFRKFWVE
jgi:KDO2-lipid IV(A) lauroyltransferase